VSEQLDLLKSFAPKHLRETKEKEPLMPGIYSFQNFKMFILQLVCFI